MSGTNANCHVSSKWEDTGGNNNPECGATVLLNHESNDISLQELIEKELALRGSAAAPPNKKLVCDMDAKTQSNMLILAEKMSAENVLNGCSKTVVKSHHKMSNVTEVDDFDVLYNEVSASNDEVAEVVAEEIVTNGHHDVTDKISSDPFDDICKKGDLLVFSRDENSLKDVENNLKDVSSDTTARSSVVFDSLETSASETTASSSPSQQQQQQQHHHHLDSVSFDNNLSNKNLVVIDNNVSATNPSDNDFVPVSEVQIITDDSAIEADATVVLESKSEPESQLEPELKPESDADSKRETLIISSQQSVCVTSQEWVRVSDVTTHEPSEEERRSSSEDLPAEPELKSEVAGESETVEESRESSIFGEQLGTPEEIAIECSNADLSVHLAEQQVSDVEPYAAEETGYSTKLDDLLDDDFEAQMESTRIHANELVLPRDDDYFGDVAMQMQVDRSRMQNGLMQRLSESELIEGCSFGLLNGCDVVSDSNVNSAEKKSVKKKKSTSEETSTTTKTKKTKKTKKYEEKENISVNNIQTSNGFDDLNFHQIEDNSDELLNVCVRDLKIMYCNEASKTNGSKLAQYEEPVPASIPIKELTRSFGDLRVVPGPESPTQINGSRSGFGKFDQLTKKTVMHVRSSDPTKAQQQFSQNDGSPDSGSLCRACNKNVFAMEQIKAERAVWHKNCFRCKTCNKQLTVDVYSSHEGELFCKPHFRDLFKPKVVVEEEKPYNVTRNSVAKEKPIAFNKMNDVKKNWENGSTTRREERQEERRQERQNIRSRLFQGKQNKMREAYENAVAESERGNVKKDVEVRSEKARTIKEKFEKGEVLHDESDEEQDRKCAPKNDDGDVFEAGISKKSREIFQQMDAAIKTQNNSFSSPPQPTQNGHRSHRESESPEREISKDPNVVRCEEPVDNEDEVLKKSNTTAKMLSLFRQLEEAQEVVPDGLKPMKKFTPPPASNSSSSEEESEEESEEPSEASIVLDDVVRSSDKTEDEYLKTAQNAFKAKSLKEKFEKWEPEKQSNNNAVNLLDSEQASLDTTKSLRARFESMKAEQPTDKPRAKVNRFVDKSLPGYCDTCFKKVYPLEKVEAGDKVFHRSCFKCTRCSGILRMETFTMNNGHLYCVPHFKQLFITKGNYDEGFGNDQHKAKWPVHTGIAMTNGLH